MKTFCSTKALCSTLFPLFFLTASAWANVTVSSPASGDTVSASAHYVASATTTTCSRGVASMGVYVDNQLIRVVNGTHLDTNIDLALGKRHTVVEEWDYCGGATFTTIDLTVANQGGVWVGSPAPNSSINSLANYTATATSSCSKGVASMGVYVNNKLLYVQQGAKLNTQMTLTPGPQHTVVEEWDYCGGAAFSTIDVNVLSNQKKIANIQASKRWNSWGQFAPDYVDCAPCDAVTWAITPGIASPSTTGSATRFDIAGTKPYGDVLFSNPLIGQFSTQGLPDSNHTILPTLHNFVYDTDFYVSNASVTQVLEFDVNMYMNGVGMIWGTQCNNLGGKGWDIWDNVNAKWMSTGVPCTLIDHGWNHVTVQVQRGADNSLIYQSITLNGAIANINKSYAPFTVPPSWYGITVNYQMDGDHKPSPNTTYLDDFSLTYW
jgi:hypothetical protein